MASLVLGPMLRHVDETSATIWVQTDVPCKVEVLTSTERACEQTWTVAERHYALVCLQGLEPGTVLPYEVRLDGQHAWPPETSRFPGSRIRTIDPSRPVRLLFGSCRYASPLSVTSDGRYGTDALDAYARTMASLPDQDWPDGLLLLGDQVYADDTSPLTKDFIRRRRDVSKPPYTEVADFSEYAELYHESWGDPMVRWLFATVPTAMIFDDHDVHDDWNTSQVWRERMHATGWWEERITGALMSYWVYQHIGNLAPADLEEDETYQKVRQSPDAEPVLREFAQHADREVDGVKGTQWSYRRDFGRVRLLMIDSRCGRILAEGRRSMVSDPEFHWIESQVDGDYDHLLVGTSLPWLLPRAVHDMESWDEALCAGVRGRWLAKLGETWREAADMEHWAAFRRSFDRLSALLARVGRGDTVQHGPPATVCVLSGDVHHAYIARARWPEPVQSPVYQVVCSPFHHTVPRSQRLMFRLGWSRRLERVTRVLDTLTKVPPPSLSWSKVAGPFFGNQLGTLVLDGRSARFALSKAVPAPGRSDRLETVLKLPLT
jgi:PhoD-like phosphatase